MSTPDIRNYPDIMLACQSIADLVGNVCKVPSTLIMRQNIGTMEVITSSTTDNTPYQSAATESLGSGLYCETVIATQRPLHVPDALNDPLWDKNPDIKLGMISYYGTPVNWPDGTPFGTFCALKNIAGEFNSEQINIINEFAAVVETLLKQVTTQDELRILAEHDHLTQVYTRGYLLEKLQHEFERFKRYNTPLSIIFLDVDHFKSINDSYGHGTGDLALKLIAGELITKQRQTDFVGRLGGEEFLICLSNTELNDSIKQAERLLKLIRAITMEVNNTSIDITASCGVAQVNSHDDTVEKLIARADKALYKAKEAGRNRVEAAK